MQVRHLGRQTCLVDENETLGIEVRLGLEPLALPLQDIGPPLFRCKGRFFDRPASSAKPGAQGAMTDDDRPLPRQARIISFSVMSRRSSISLMMKASCASRREALLTPIATVAHVLTIVSMAALGLNQRRHPLRCQGRPPHYSHGRPLDPRADDDLARAHPLACGALNHPDKKKRA